MIRTLTIVENTAEGRLPEYTVNGTLPIDDAAKALVIVAFNAGQPQPKKEEGAVKSDG